MGMTIAEKIIALAAGVPEVKAGDIHTVTLDRMMSNDGTTHLTVDMYNNKLKHPHIADPKKMVFIVDHNVPADSPKTAASQKKMRDFARENNIDFWEGKGVCHQIMMENYVCPGELIFGADSHTCTYGALGAFGTGVGCTDLLYGMVTGTSWVLVPETVKFNLTGKLPEGVYPRDLMLTIIGQIGANGVKAELLEKQLPESAVNALADFIAAGEVTLDAVAARCADPAIADDLKYVLATANAMAAGRYQVAYCPSLVRGQGYYTGMVFEITCPQFSGAVAGGGRYDNMVGKFLGTQVPAVGFSIGFERVCGILLEQGYQIPGAKQKIALLYGKDADFTAVLSKAAALRDTYNVTVLPQGKKLGKQLGQLEAAGFAGAAFMDKDEVKVFAAQ